MRNKKGISPLIATVLLIGFTVVLAALIFRWIGPLVTGPQKDITCNYLVTVACSNKVDLAIISATNVSGTDIEINIENKGSKQIDGFVFKLTDNIGDITSQILNDPATDILDPYSNKRYIVTVANTLLITKVEAIPQVSETDTEGTLCKKDCVEKSVSTTTFQ